MATTVTKAFSTHSRWGLAQTSDPHTAQHSQLLSHQPSSLKLLHSLVQPYTPSKESFSVVFALGTSTKWLDENGRGIEWESDLLGHLPNSSQLFHVSVFCYQSVAVGPFISSWQFVISHGTVFYCQTRPSNEREEFASGSSFDLQSCSHCRVFPEPPSSFTRCRFLVLYL